MVFILLVLGVSQSLRLDLFMTYSNLKFMSISYSTILNKFTSAVSRRLPTAAARVRARSSGICGGQSGTGAGFIRVFRFPLPFFIPPTAPHSSTIQGWYNRPTGDRRTKWTQCHPTKKFWEELIVYFPWHDTDPTENAASNNSVVACVFIAAVTFLPSFCLATIGRYTDTV
jgi:hypothetical protein